MFYTIEQDVKNRKFLEMNLLSLPQQKAADPCALIIFGITGDLTKRLLIPALCNLGSKKLLDNRFYIIGIATSPLSQEEFQSRFIQDIKQFVTNAEAKKYGLDLVKRIHYLSGNFNEPEVFAQLKNKLDGLTKENGNLNYLFYYAAPPEFIITLTRNLSQAKLLEEDKDSARRIIIEKPFGQDLVSAKKLNKKLLTYVKEKQIFRIDHYLGKETVQNLIALRFSNAILEPVWNCRYVDHVQITVAETLGVEMRGGFYEKAGALRDMVSSHLLQLLSLIAMEPPIAFASKYVNQEKSKVLHAVQICTPEQVISQTVRGQYGPGKINGVAVPGYREEPKVNPESAVETFVALKMLVNTWRWLNVPFYVRTGKRMNTRSSEIIIQFKSGPAVLFDTPQKSIMPNLLRINIQPNEGIKLRFNAKIPGQTLHLGQVNMDFKYEDYFGMESRTGYETVLYDCMNGDHTLFEHAEIVETAWAILQPILDVWSALTPRDFPNYSAGSMGPEAATELLTRDGRSWIL